jgi:hypothetical protein
MKPKRKRKPLTDQQLISELHTQRIYKYMKALKITTVDKAMESIILIHRRGLNSSRVVSEAIGANHDKYIKTLQSYNEYPSFIR